jgi:hypothetical protein
MSLRRRLYAARLLAFLPSLAPAPARAQQAVEKELPPP